MFIVERESFIDWTRGYLLRRERGKLVVGDRKENEEAMKRLEAGETIYLTVDNEVFSRLNKVDSAFVEEKIDAPI